MKSAQNDMTVGNPMKIILSFTLPIFLGNVFQQFYNMADAVIVGKFVGNKALAAVGSTGTIMFLIYGFVVGMTAGFTVLTAQKFGAGDMEGMRKTVVGAGVLSFVIGALLTVLFMVFMKPLLILMNTPADIFADAYAYIMIVSGGILAQMLYNLLSSILRALGNSRTPLIAMIIASFISVVLDLVFVAGLKWGVAGAALATVTAQAFSAFYCFLIVRKIKIVHTDRDDFARVPGLNRKLFGLGAPILFQDVIISVGGLAVQFVINGYGFLFVAGFTATNKLYGVLEMAAISYGYAVVSYVGQNLGAGEIRRIKKGVHASAFLAFLTSAFISVMMFLFGKTLLSMFISGNPEQTDQVLAIAWHYLSIMASCLCILYFLYVYRSALQGLGNTMIPMLSGVVEFFVRVGVALLLPKLVGQNGIFYAEIAAWTGAAVLLVISYYLSLRKFA